MRRPEPTRRNLLTAGGGVFAVALVVATAFSCTHSDPELGPAAFRPTTTVTTTPATTSLGPATGPETTTTTSAPSSTEDPSSDSTEGSTAPAGLTALPARTSEVATARGGGELTLYESATGASTGSISGTGDYGQPQVFLVIGREADRLHVLLPIRPNGSKGWIDAGAVDVASHDYQIQVSLSGFQMVVQEGHDIILDTAIGVGTQDTPTIGGEFYTWVLLDPTNQGYGSYAYGLSGFSTLTQFAGGDGRMGMHGTTDASSIGRNVSHGCVRLPDDVVVRMVEEIGLPLGVPVTVTA